MIDTLLLLALPASGKSELRRYLAHLPADVAARDLGLGPTVQLDDYPYVHLMRRVDQELRSLGVAPIFFAADDQPMFKSRDWGTLIELVNQDYAGLGSPAPPPPAPAEWLFARFDAARAAVGLTPPFVDVTGHERARLAAALDDEAARLAADLAGTSAAYTPGESTVLVEFARGGPAGVAPPYPEPLGYAYSLRTLSDEILRRACILYVWVTPDESRRRNRARAVPGRDGDASILHHGVPEMVMHEEYGGDDLLWLVGEGDGTTVTVATDGGDCAIPTAVFDNRTDHTSFLRDDAGAWPPEAVATLHRALIGAFSRLVPSP